MKQDREEAGEEGGGRKERKKKVRRKGKKRMKRKRGGRKEGGESQQNFLQSKAHRIPIGWAYRCATQVRVKIFNKRMVSALTNGMETPAGAGQGPRDLLNSVRR